MKDKLQVMAITECRPDDNRFEDLKLAAIPYEKEKRAYVLENQIYIPESKVLLIRTQEIPAWSNIHLTNWRLNCGAEGHLLLVGNKSGVSEGRLEEVLDNARAQRAIVILNHMFAGPQDALAGVGYFNFEEQIVRYFSQQKIHAVEDSGLLRSKGLINAIWKLNKANTRALEFAEKYGLVVVANSDAHSASEMGRAHTDIPVRDNNWEKYLSEIKSSILLGDENMIAKPEPAPLFCSEKHALNLIPDVIKKYSGVSFRKG